MNDPSVEKRIEEIAREVERKTDLSFEEALSETRYFWQRWLGATSLDARDIVSLINYFRGHS